MASASPEASAKQGTGGSRNAASSCGFTHREVAEAIAASNCNNPVHCMQTLHEVLMSKMHDPMTTHLFDYLKSEYFFELTEKDAEGRKCQELVQLATAKDATPFDRVRHLLDQVETKTNRLAGVKRYDQESPFVIFICSLAKSECGLELAKRLLDCITERHICKKDPQPTGITTTPANPETGAAVGAIARASQDELDGMEPEEFEELVFSLLPDLCIKYNDGVSSRQVTLALEGKPDTGACTSKLKKKVTPALYRLQRKRLLSAVKDRNPPCWKVVQGVPDRSV